MENILKRFTSRKFLLALSAFIAAVANNDIALAVSVVLGYLAVEGGADIVSARK